MTVTVTSKPILAQCSGMWYFSEITCMTPSPGSAGSLGAIYRKMPRATQTIPRTSQISCMR